MSINPIAKKSVRIILLFSNEGQKHKKTLKTGGKMNINRLKMKLKILFIYILICYVVIAFSFVFYARMGWCKGKESKSASNKNENIFSEDNDEVIVRIGKEAIIAADLKEYLSYRPLSSTSSVTLEELDQRLNEMIISEALYQEAFKLKRIGEICDHVIETGHGYHVIMLVERRPALDRPLEEVKSLIERRIRREELENTRESYIKRVKEATDIQREDQAITDLFECSLY